MDTEDVQTAAEWLKRLSRDPVRQEDPVWEKASIVAHYTLAALEREAAIAEGAPTNTLFYLGEVDRLNKALNSTALESALATTALTNLRARLRALVEEGRHAQECAWVRPLYSHTIGANVPVYHTNVEPCDCILADLRALLDGDVLESAEAR